MVFLNGKSDLTDGEYSSLVLYALRQLAKTAKSKLESTDIEKPFATIIDQQTFYKEQLKALKDATQRFKYDHDAQLDDDDEEEDKLLFSDV